MSLIYVDHLKKTYNGGEEKVRAVDDVTLEIEEGAFLAMMGPSGSGKSTLLTILGGLNNPTEGTVVVNDIDLYSLSGDRLADFRREYVGFVFQSFQLIPYLTVIENVMLPLAVTPNSNGRVHKTAESILEKVGLETKASRLPDDLSGGEQQRVAIARALVNEPPIILADEPTGNLDTGTSDGIMRLFQTLNEEGITIVMVTHNEENVKYANEVIHLRDGKLSHKTGPYSHFAGLP